MPAPGSRDAKGVVSDGGRARVAGWWGQIPRPATGYHKAVPYGTIELLKVPEGTIGKRYHFCTSVPWSLHFSVIGLVP